MRPFVTALLAFAVLVALALPVSYEVLSRELPPLASHAEVLNTIKLYVEGQRQRQFAGVDARMVEPFALLTEKDLALGLRAGALAVQGCPEYGTLPKEHGAAWLLRVVAFGAGAGYGGAGPGRCELQFANRIALSLGLSGGSARALAAHQIHDALDKAELLDAELSSRYFAPGILGVKAASRKLIGKDPRALSLAESAEVLLAEQDWPAVHECKNPITLRLRRNNLLETMAALNLVPSAEAERAKNERLRCLDRPN